MPDTQTVRFPAEWEPQQAVIIAWPHPLTDWLPRLGSVESCYVRMSAAIARHVSRLVIITTSPDHVSSLIRDDVDMAKVTFLDYLTNDTWIRDFGPLSVLHTCPRGTIPTLCDFQFNGWGMKFAAGRDNQATSHIYTDSVFPGFDYDNCLDFVLEGGSIESDGRGLILTTSQCLLSANRNDTLTPVDIEARLKRSLGAKKVLWLDYGSLEGDDTDGHVDTIARLVAPDAIAYSICDRQEDSHFPTLRLMELQLKGMTGLDGNPFRLFPLPIPRPIHDENGERLPATYANFLILNRAVIMPVYGDDRYDATAVRTMSEALPGYEIETVDCRELIRQHGSLHCATMQVPEF